LKIYAQYSHEQAKDNFLSPGEYKLNYFQAGAEISFSEESRHSFKLGISKFQTDGLDLRDNYYNNNDEFWDFNISYHYDTFRLPNSNVYVGLNLFDAYWLKNEDGKKLHKWFRLLPLVGYEYHIFKKMDAYAEINNMFSISNIPLNFSVGLTYDL